MRVNLGSVPLHADVGDGTAGLGLAFPGALTQFAPALFFCVRLEFGSSPALER